MFYRWFALFLGACLCGSNATALTAPVYQISTVAGSGSSGFRGDAGVATAAQLATPMGVAVDAQGVLYVADKYNHRIRKITPDGTISTVAGNGAAGYSGDGGAALKAQLNSPQDVAVDAQGRLYVADTENHSIRQIDSKGIIRTFAGRGKEGSSGDGAAATSAYLRTPGGLAVDAQGIVYIADTGNHRIRKVDTKGIIQRIAGASLKSGFAGDGGAALDAAFNHPQDVAVDGNGTLYIADEENHRIRKIDKAGNISMLAGGVTQGYTADGSEAKYALLSMPSSLAVDAQGRLFIADGHNHRIRLVDAQGVIHTIAGSGLTEIGNGGFAGTEIPAARARLFYPQGLTVDSNGILYLADTHNQRVRKLSVLTQPTALIESVIGARDASLRGGSSGDDGAAKAAKLQQVSGLAFDAQGILYLADQGNHRLRQVDADGVIRALAGNGTAGDVDGAALSAQFNLPAALVADAAGNFYIADQGNHKIRKLDAQGYVSTFAGTGKKGDGGGGGAATQAQLSSPSGLALGADGSLYIADQDNHRVRKVAPDGTISTVAGNGKAGSSGDGGAATAAQLNNPSALAMDTDGNLFIADRQNYRIRKLDAQGVISTVAGTGKAGYGDDGTALQVHIDGPNGLVFDAAGVLYFTERNTDRVRKLTSDGQVITVAGTGGLGFSGDGDPALSAQLYAPTGVAIHPLSGDLFVADTLNHRVRRVYLPQFQLQVQITGAGSVQLSAAQRPLYRCSTACTYSYLPDTAVQLQAMPAAGAVFSGWSQCANATDAQISLQLSADVQCQASFTATAPDAQPADDTEAPPLKPSSSDQAQPLPILEVQEKCAGVDQTLSLDLASVTDGKTILKQINALSVFKDGSMQIFQEPRQGYLILQQGALRLSVQPRIAQFSTQSLADQQEALQLGLQQETLLRLPQSDGKVLDLFAQPAVQGLCVLQKHFARLGYPRIQVSNDGNLRIQPSDAASTWLSLRPDWIATAIVQDSPDGLLLSGSLFPNGYPSISLIFSDAEGQKRQQFFYTAPADLSALQDAVQNLAIQPFAPWRFSWQGNDYTGILHQSVQPGKGDGALHIKTIEDANGDGVSDYRVSYPNGDQQLFFNPG